MRPNLFLIPMLAAGLAFAQSDVVQLRVPPPLAGESAGPQTVMFSHAAEASVGAVEFVRSEFGSDATVKGAPYTAEAATESVQVLPDGNRIVHRDATTLARDSEGRTRRDMTMPLIPGMSASEAPKFSFLFDPTTNTSFTLDHNSRTARKSVGRSFSIQISSKVPAGGGVMGGILERSDEAGATESMKFDTRGKMVQHDVVGRTEHTAMTVPDTPGIRVARAVGTQGGKTENLGKQTMEGVLVEGTRTVATIPAGEIGNERPIEIVSERWYSPELRTVVMSRHSDPRQGETTYKLTNIRTGEPLKSLFEVPADYSVEALGDKIQMLRRKASPKE